MPVDRCVCHRVMFAELLRLAEAEGLDLAALAERTGCTTGCGTCEPYIRASLATGCAELPAMSPGQLERLILASQHAQSPGSPLDPEVS
ncbi:MAG: (2Fe-2S)-binding protein [Planctomycetota bacterium]